MGLVGDGLVMLFVVLSWSWLVGWLQLPSKEDEPRERNLRDGGVYGDVLYG